MVIEQFNQNFHPLPVPTIIQFNTRERETRIRLHKIDLSVFSNSYEDWYFYQDTFEKLIHLNEDLTKIEKFHYLRSSLKDKIAEIIHSIDITTDNYQDA